jgi:hypothetical protein
LASVETTVRCSVVVPPDVTATGVDAERPAPTSSVATSLSTGSALRTTSVAASATLRQSGTVRMRR